MPTLRRYLLCLCLCCLAVTTYSQTPTPSPKATPSPTVDCERLKRELEHIREEYETRLKEERERVFYNQSSPALINGLLSGRTLAETQLGWGVLIFGLLIIGLEVVVMLKLQKGWGTQSIRVTGLTLVLTSGLFLIVTGYSQEQIAPMIGLLGTITGFLLGKTASTKEPE